jgi:hypothetical protein
MSTHISSMHREIPWPSLNTSHPPLADFTSLQRLYFCCWYSTPVFNLVAVIRRPLLNCQTMDLFRDLYRSDKFAYNIQVVECPVSTFQRLFKDMWKSEIHRRIIYFVASSHGRLVMMGWDWRLRAAATTGLLFIPDNCDVDHGMMV